MVEDSDHESSDSTMDDHRNEKTTIRSGVGLRQHISFYEFLDVVYHDLLKIRVVQERTKLDKDCMQSAFERNKMSIRLGVTQFFTKHGVCIPIAIVSLGNIRRAIIDALPGSLHKAGWKQDMVILAHLFEWIVAFRDKTDSARCESKISDLFTSTVIDVCVIHSGLGMSEENERAIEKMHSTIHQWRTYLVSGGYLKYLDVECESTKSLN